MPKKKSSSYPSGMLSALRDLGNKGFGRFSKKEYLKAIRLHPDKDGLISNIFENSVKSILKLKRQNPTKLTTYMQESHQKNNLMIFHDKLNSYSHGQGTKAINTLLLKILARELILKEKACKPFWTDACKDLSEKLWLPTKTDCQDLDLISSNSLSQKPEESSRSLTILEIPHQNKNLQKTCSASSISTHVDKWVSDRITNEKEPEFKTLVIPFNPTKNQKKRIDYDLQVSNYKYNQTIGCINDPNEQTKTKLGLRNKLVTQDTRMNNILWNKVGKAKSRIEGIVRKLKKSRSIKDIVKAVMITIKCLRPIQQWHKLLKEVIQSTKNPLIREFETKTHKDVKDGAVFEAHKNWLNSCNAVKSGRIKHFTMKYRSKKKNGLSMRLTTKMISIRDGILRLSNKELKGNDKIIHVGRRSQQKLRGITTLRDCTLTKKFGIYKLHIPLDIVKPEPIKPKKVIGIDPGVSTFLSCYASDKIITIKQSDKCKQYDLMLQRLKEPRSKNRKRLRASRFRKYYTKKDNITNELHWKSITYLLKNYDIIFIEKFDSQGFVKNGKSKSLNSTTNNLKPYMFRQRLLYKAFCYGKIVEVVPAHNTTKSCSNCGRIRRMTLKDRVYECKGCNLSFDRDFNAAKNMILKGLTM